MSEEIKTKEVYPINEVANEIIEQLIEEKKVNAKTLNKLGVEKSNFIVTLLQRMLGKLLFKLKIKIVVYWDDKELFEYVIPKN